MTAQWATAFTVGALVAVLAGWAVDALDRRAQRRRAARRQAVWDDDPSTFWICSHPGCARWFNTKADHDAHHTLAHRPAPRGLDE